MTSQIYLQENKPSLDLTVVIPLFNEDESIGELAAWIHRVAAEVGISYEILMIDDGSKDRSWEVIEQLSADSNQVRGVRFKRNYGKSAALNVGTNKNAKLQTGLQVTSFFFWQNKKS